MLDRKYSAIVSLEDILMDEDLGPLSKCDPMLSSPDNNPPSAVFAASGQPSTAHHRCSAPSTDSSSSGSSSSRCSSVDNLDSLDVGGGVALSLDRDHRPPVRGRPPAASGRPRKGPTAAVKRLERGVGCVERAESGRGSEVYLGPRTTRIPVVTRTSIITSTALAAAAAANSANPPPPSPFSMIFPLPEEISQLTEEFLPSSASTVQPFHHHPLLDNGQQHHHHKESASSKQVSLEILPGSSLSHQDLGGFFVTDSAAADNLVTTELSCSRETLSERCLSLDDLRNSNGGGGFQHQQAVAAVHGCHGGTSANRATTAVTTTYSLHPLHQLHHHQPGTCTQKKVILEERPVTPHSSHADKVYLHL